MTRWVQPPDAQDLLDAYAIAAGLLSVEHADLRQPQDPRSRAKTVAAEMARWPSDRFANTENYLAAVALAVAGGKIVTVRDPEKARTLAAVAGVLAAATLAERLLLVLDMRHIWKVVEPLERGHQSDLAAKLAQHLSPVTPTIRVVVLTPLSEVNREQQSKLLEVANAVKGGLDALIIDIPGTRLAPDVVPNWPSAKMRTVERQRILSASIAVVINGEFASWGAAQCTAWLESVGVPVMVYGSCGSRVLTSSSPAGTVHVPYSTKEAFEPTAADIVTRVNDQLSSLRDRALFNYKLQEQWLDQGLHARQVLPAMGLPLQRVAQIFSSPLEFATMSSFEASTLSVTNAELLRDARAAFDAATLRTFERWSVTDGELADFEYAMARRSASRLERLQVLEMWNDARQLDDSGGHGNDTTHRRVWGASAWEAALAKVRR